MGGLEDVAKTTYTLGFGGKHGIGASVFGLKGGLFGEKDKKKSPAQQQAEAAPQDSPTGPAADVNAQLIQRQGADRRRRLLTESTGRTPTGPAITTSNNNRTLF